MTERKAPYVYTLQHPGEKCEYILHMNIIHGIWGWQNVFLAASCVLGSIVFPMCHMIFFSSIAILSNLSPLVV
jgi:hypothetical protein